MNLGDVVEALTFSPQNAVSMPDRINVGVVVAFSGSQSHIRCVDGVRRNYQTVRLRLLSLEEASAIRLMMAPD